MSRLAVLGVRSVPVVVRGDRFVFAQYLEDVAAFLGLDKSASASVDTLALARRLIEILRVAQEVLIKTPSAEFAAKLPGRDRSLFVVAHHVFQIAAAAKCGISAGVLRDRDSLAEPPTSMKSVEDLKCFANSTLSDLSEWPMALAESRDNDEVLTDYGPRSLADSLHRVVSHAAQHTRQLSAWALTRHVHLERELNPALLEGLTIADESFDKAPRDQS